MKPKQHKNYVIPCKASLSEHLKAKNPEMYKRLVCGFNISTRGHK